MRHKLLLSALVLAACADPNVRGLTEPDTDLPTGPMYTVSGVVIDSVSGGVLPGARVTVGKATTEADAGGQWSLAVPGGDISIAATPTGYERTSFAFTLRTNAFVTLQARRLAPIVQDCVLDGSYVHALVSDLQGRKSIERWQRSQATILDPSGDYTIGAPAWYYRAVDYVTWEVTVGPLTPESTGIRWNVYDAEGHLYSAVCEPAVAQTGE